MNKAVQQERWLQYGLMLTGLLISAAAAVQLIVFTGGVTQQEKPTLSQWFLGLILPHIILLAGLGIIVAGIIIAIRRTTINKRLQHEEV